MKNFLLSLRHAFFPFLFRCLSLRALVPQYFVSFFDATVFSFFGAIFFFFLPDQKSNPQRKNNSHTNSKVKVSSHVVDRGVQGAFPDGWQWQDFVTSFCLALMVLISPVGMLGMSILRSLLDRDALTMWIRQNHDYCTTTPSTQFFLYPPRPLASSACYLGVHVFAPGLDPWLKY